MTAGSAPDALQHDPAVALTLIYRTFATFVSWMVVHARPDSPKRSRSLSCATSLSCCNAAPRDHGFAGPIERSSPRWPGCCRHDVASVCWSIDVLRWHRQTHHPPLDHPARPARLASLLSAGWGFDSVAAYV